LEDTSNPLEYFELFCTPEIAEIMAREYMPNIKLESSTHYWKETNRSEIMKLLAVFLLHGPHQKLDELFFPG
jgi:hypothetical protein